MKQNYKFSFNQILDENNSWNENQLKNFFQGDFFSFKSLFHENQLKNFFQGDFFSFKSLFHEKSFIDSSPYI